MIDYKHLQHLPKHLLDYVVDQNYDQYTHIDHAIWRYVMRQNIDFLPSIQLRNFNYTIFTLFTTTMKHNECWLITYFANQRCSKICCYFI